MYESEFTIPISSIIEEFELEKICEPENIDEVLVSTSDVNRPGLQMAGFFDYFDDQRIQIMGKVEFTYLEKLSADEREKRLETYFGHNFPALVVTRGLQVFPEMKELAEKYDRILLRTELSTSDFMSALIRYLNVQIAPRRTRHGVLVEVYGEGILIMGESGVGKSETAIELVKRGHRLVADDAVEIKRVSDKSLLGSAPDIIRHFIELRGIGIVDVKMIFGMGAVKNTEKIDMVINLEVWKEKKQYDRLGLNTEYTELLGIEVPSITIPVKPGRNLAVVVEVAAMNHRQKKMGYNAAEALNNRLINEMETKE